jgi:hypothetical protein
MGIAADAPAVGESAIREWAAAGLVEVFAQRALAQPLAPLHAPLFGHRRWRCRRRCRSGRRIGGRGWRRGSGHWLRRLHFGDLVVPGFALFCGPIVACQGEELQVAGLSIAARGLKLVNGLPAIGGED